MIPKTPHPVRRGSYGRREEARLAWPLGISECALIEALREELSLVASGGYRVERVLLDTFDRRFRRSGKRLAHRGGNLASEIELTTGLGKDRPRVRIQAIDKTPSFAWDLPPGDIREAVEQLAKQRRLLPVLSLREDAQRYVVLDDEEKTVLRLLFCKGRAQDPQDSTRIQELGGFVRVLPVRGHRKAFRKATRLLKERGLEDAPEDLVEVGLRTLGVDEEPPPSKPTLPISAEEPAATVALKFLRATLAVIRANEDGIRRDLDVEYLHDLRVAVRRSRTLLRIFAKRLARSEADSVNADFEWLGRITGPTRDLDVHLLELRQEAARLAEEEREQLEPLVGWLGARRQEAWGELVHALDSDRYVACIARIEAFVACDGPVAQQAAKDMTTIGSFASKRLSKAFAQLLERGRILGPETPDGPYHRLRLAGKRLRYLVEFFQGLYDPRALEGFLKTMRRLQDELGAFNDACVQQEVLRELAHTFAKSGGARAETLLVTGQLVEKLEGRRKERRLAALRRFAELECVETKEHYERIWERAGKKAVKERERGKG